MNSALYRVWRNGFALALLLSCALTLCGCPAKEPAAADAGKSKSNIEMHGDAMTITDPESGAKLTMGDSNAALPADWPDWLPQYPASKVVLQYARDNADGKSNVVMLDTLDPGSQVLDFYLQKAQVAGLRLTDDSRGPQGSALTLLSAERTLNLMVSPGEKKTSVTLQLMVKTNANLPDEAQVFWMGVNALPPSWPSELLPVYPGSQIAMVSIRTNQSPSEYALQFTAKASAKQLKAWYSSEFSAHKLGPDQSAQDSSGAQSVFSGPQGVAELTCLDSETPGVTKVKLTFHPAGKLALSAPLRPIALHTS